MGKQEKKKTAKIHYASFHIAGFGYWEGCEAFEQLKIGKKLELVREEDNRYDPCAVAIYFDTYKLGYIPRGDNRDISIILDMGRDNILETRITRISPDAHPESQIEVIVYMKDRKLNYNCIQQPIEP